MQFRQNGQRDERRRRVLREESLTSPATAKDEVKGAGGVDGEPKAPARGYSTAVSLESQPRISCLIASRPWTLSVFVLAGLAVIAGLEAAYGNLHQTFATRPELTAAFDVNARGSLAAWFSSLLLAMAAVNAALVYWLRSHKLDDYRGRYRVWLWSTLGLAIAAVSAATGLHSVVGHLISGYFATSWLQNPTLNGVAALTLIFGSLAVRMTFEIWPSRLARTCALVAAAGYLVAILIRSDVLTIDSSLLAGMAESTAMLLATLSVAFAVASYCRYVYLESQDALAPRRQRPAKPSKPSKPPADAERQPAKKASSKDAASQQSPGSPPEKSATRKTLRTETLNSKTIRCDSAHQSPGETRPPSASTESAKPAANAADESDYDESLDYDPETGEPLSKSERRRLRKLMRRQKKTGSG